MSKELPKIELRQLSTACPEDYNAYLDGKQVAYLRLRHGYFSVEAPDREGNVIYSSCPKGDGIFDSEEERTYHIQRAVNAIMRWLRQQEEEKLAEFEFVGYESR